MGFPRNAVQGTMVWSGFLETGTRSTTAVLLGTAGMNGRVLQQCITDPALLDITAEGTSCLSCLCSKPAMLSLHLQSPHGFCRSLLVTYFCLNSIIILPLFPVSNSWDGPEGSIPLRIQHHQPAHELAALGHRCHPAPTRVTGRWWWE